MVTKASFRSPCLYSTLCDQWVHIWLAGATSLTQSPSPRVVVTNGAPLCFFISPPPGLWTPSAASVTAGLMASPSAPCPPPSCCSSPRATSPSASPPGPEVTQPPGGNRGCTHNQYRCRVSVMMIPSTGISYQCRYQYGLSVPISVLAISNN